MTSPLSPRNPAYSLSDSMVPASLPSSSPLMALTSGDVHFFNKMPLVFPLGHPSEDSHLHTGFSSRTLRDRKRNQAALELCVGKETQPALLLYPRLFSDHQGLLLGLLPALADTNCHIVVLADAKECQAKNQRKVTVFPVIEKNVHALWSGADLILLPPNCSSELVESCFRYGLIPIVADNQGLVMDYDPVLEKGNAFTYQVESIWQIHAALVRALETYKLSFDWQRIQKNGMDM